jgi:hypothetical protein
LLFTVRDQRSESDLKDKKIERSKIAPKLAEQMVLQKVPMCELIDEGFTQKELRCEIQIIASSERVWQVLLDDQNIVSKPIRNAIRAIRKHTRIEQVPTMTVGKQGKPSKAILSRVQPNNELAWKIRCWIIPGLLQRENIFQIVSDSDGLGVRLIQREIFSGILVPFVKKAIHVARRDIQLKNVEIREKAENIG